jgi:hypothetical protein
MVKESMDKVFLVALHSQRRGGSCHYFLGENKNSRREAMDCACIFWCYHIVGSWARRFTFLGSLDVSG